MLDLTPEALLFHVCLFLLPWMQISYAGTSETREVVDVSGLPSVVTVSLVLPGCSLHFNCFVHDKSRSLGIG